MLNKAPIFLNGFKYGGTNMIMNLLASHPEVCLLSGETQEVFRSRKERADRFFRKLLYAPIRLSSASPVFDKTAETHAPRTLSSALMPYADLLLYCDKMTASQNLFRAEGVRYRKSELHGCRFLAKNVNGLVFTSAIFSRMYPDAVFIAMVRDGLALCEGYLRRGWTAAEAGELYRTVCEKMVADSVEIPNYHIVRFEDMITDPAGFMRQIYEYAGLDLSRVSRVRLQSKRSMSMDGKRSYTFGGSRDRDVHWFTTEELRNHVRQDVNRNQAELLGEENRRLFLAEAGEIMKKLGYL